MRRKRHHAAMGTFEPCSRTVPPSSVQGREAGKYSLPSFTAFALQGIVRRFWIGAGR